MPDSAENYDISRHVWRFDELVSCLDTAMRLAERGRLALWDSVQAVRQTAGRGQLRRHWHSPSGNVYAALRLPLTPPFDSTAAAPVVAALLAEALREEGWSVRLKWPNDLVLFRPDRGPQKLAGILLEERGGVLLAGVGINVCSAPPASVLRTEASLEATCLAAGAPHEGCRIPVAEELWQLLVKRMHSAYVYCHSFTDWWKTRAEALLLWRGETVELRDEGHAVRGRLAGLSAAGGLCLMRHGRVEEFFCGSLRLVSDMETVGL